MNSPAPGTAVQFTARLILVPALLVTAACASIGRPVNQEVQISPMSRGEQVEASCDIGNDRGKWSIIAPTVIGVTRSSTQLTVRCTDGDGRQASKQVDSQRTGATSLSSAGYDYPTVVMVDMDSTPADPIAETVAVATRALTPVDDVSKLPHIDESGRDGYQRFLAGPSPRAFAIAGNGYWVRVNGSRGADRLALDRCQSAGMLCQLYAIDGKVVWPATPAPQLVAAH